MITIVGLRGAGKTWTLMQVIKSWASYEGNYVLVVPDAEMCKCMRRDYPDELANVEVISAHSIDILRGRGDVSGIFVDEWDLIGRKAQDAVAHGPWRVIARTRFGDA